jgi:hypothetical protein
MRETLEKTSETIGTAAEGLLLLAERLNDGPADTVRRAAVLLDEAAELLSDLYVATAAHQVRGRPPSSMSVQQSAAVPLPAVVPVVDLSGQCLLWAV